MFHGRAHRFTERRQLDQTCRSCPEWSIQDVVAHHVHATGTHLNGGLPPVTYSAIVGDNEQARSDAAEARDDWAEAGVVARCGLPLAAVLAGRDDVVTDMDDRGAGMAIDRERTLGRAGAALGNERRLRLVSPTEVVASSAN